MFTIQFTPLIVPMLLAAGLSGFLAYFQWRRGPGSGTASFVALMIGAAIWTITSALELASPALQAKFTYTVANYVGITLTTAAWFTFTLEYTGQEGLLTPRYLALLTIEPVLTLVLAATNPLHHLFWTRFALSEAGTLEVVHGPAFWGHAAYSYLLMLAGAGLLIRAFIISPQFYRGQVVTMLLAAAAPWAANFLYISQLSPFPNLDLTPFGFTFTGVFLSWSMMHYHLLDVIPIARHTVIQSMGDAMLVLDKRDRILDANPAALRLFACTTTTKLFGQPVKQVLPPWAAIAEAGQPPDESDHEFRLDTDCERRTFRMHISPVHNRRGEVKGRVILLRDITSQRQAEEDLRGVLAAMRDAILVLDSEGRYLRVPHTSPDSPLPRPADLVGKTMREVFEAPKAEEFLSYIREAIETGQTVRAEYSLPVGKEERWINASISPMEDDRVVWVSRDMTKRRHAEQALHESEERFRMLFHHSPDAIVLLDPSIDDPSWPIVDCNEAFLAMNGFERSELIGKSIDIVHVNPDSTAGRQTFLEQLQREGRVENEITHERRDGTTYPVHFLSTLVNLNGKQLVLGIDRDISERKRAEQALHESEERFRMLFHHSPDAIVLFDPSVEDPLWPIVDCNEAFLAMNGFSREDLIGQSIEAVHIPHEGPEKRREFLKRLEQGGRVESEVTHSRQDGTTYPVHLLATLVNLNEKELVLGIERDISERKQAEAEIQRYRDHLEEMVAERTAELHEANQTISASLQEKEVLLKEIHHRVKNNLQVISSLLNLQSGYVEDEKAVTLFTESRNRVHSMALIHEQLYRSTDFTRVDFATYAQELTRRLLVSYRALANGIDLRLSFDEIYLDVTTAIPCGLIINELVSNAIKHGFPGGERGVIGVEMTVEKGDEGEDYRLTVHNNGMAFPEGLDFRNTDTLGLQLVNSLTRQLDGEIDLRREAGTTFEIRFPYSD